MIKVFRDGQEVLSCHNFKEATVFVNILKFSYPNSNYKIRFYT